MSVESSLYPLKEGTADIQFSLPNNTFGLDAYKTDLLRRLPKNTRDCQGRHDVTCYGLDAAEQYSIPEGSPFFPDPKSPVAALFQNLGVTVAIGDLRVSVRSSHLFNAERVQ